MEGLKKLHKGDFNYMSQEWQPDGTVIIKLSKRSENKTYRFRVRGLYKPNEKEVDIDTSKPITKRNI